MATAVSEEDVHNVVTEKLIRHGIEVRAALALLTCVQRHILRTRAPSCS